MIAASAAETADTTARAEALREVVVTSARRPVEVIPVQTLDGDMLKSLNSNSVADALRYFAGVQVKDYGGVGGIKTVNIRSMGTNHTGVVYDGVELGNAQNGQIDLGQFSLDNVEAISLYNGQRSEILQPAKDFGSAGTIYIRTRVPVFGEGETMHARATVRTGSFDLLNPSTLVELRLSRSVSASLSAEWLTSTGKYRFRYRRVNPAGELAYDTTAVRQNGDINATRMGVNLTGRASSGEWGVKAYNYNSERGVPGAIVNNVWRRGERIWDTNSFVQGGYSASFGAFSTLNHVKYAFYRTHYVNNDDKQLKIDNLYRQRELYVSTANEWAVRPFWRLSAAYDLIWNSLSADMHGFARPERLSHFVSAATALSFRRLKAQASVLGTFVHDRLSGQAAPSDKHVFTPALYLSGQPTRSRDFSLRTFVKRSFRMPTFNDLYYADMGNSRLSPERVTQYNLGALYDRVSARGVIAAARLSADVYYNRVKDKIVAYPKGQQFRWTMLNLGLVDIRGVDVSGLLSVRTGMHGPVITVRGQYTWQRAIDITDPADNYYRHQIPYIPHHSGSAVVNACWRGVTVNYSFIYVGERYNQQENIRYNYTQPWYTSDISVSLDFKAGRAAMRVMAEVNNLLSQDYDVIINYPMPKRNFRITLSASI